MTAALAPDETGQFVAVWRPSGGTVEAAPIRSWIDVAILDDLPRDPDDPGIVRLPGFVRYRIGRPHPLHRGAVYLHRLDAGDP